MWGRYDSPYGVCTLMWGASGRVERLYFDGAVEFDGDRNDAEAEQLAAKIFGGEYVEIFLCGSEFELAVWSELCNIERGTTRTYAQIAQAIGRPKAVRAVASAIGRNEVSYMVPCHRVVRSDGGMGGYRWGLDVKRRLLENENSEIK